MPRFVSPLLGTVAVPLIAITVSVGPLSSLASAQTFLERLERRLSDAIPLNPPAGVAPNATAGRGYLGLSAEDTETGAVRVLTVKAGSPALAAGIRPGDEIRSVNGAAVRSVDQMGDVLDRLAPGARVDFGIRRQGRSFDTQVTLARRDAPVETGEEIPVPPPEVAPMPTLASPQANVAANPVSGRPTLGVVLSPLTDTLRQKFGVTARNGALVTEVRPGGTAEAAGLSPGCVIVGIDGQRIDQPEPLLAAVREHEIGDSVTLSWYEGNELRRQAVALRAAPTSGALPNSAGPKTPATSGRRPSAPAPELAPPGTQPPRAAENIFGDEPPVPESLEEQVRRLTRTVELLERRVEQLEKRLELPP